MSKKIITLFFTAFIFVMSNSCGDSVSKPEDVSYNLRIFIDFYGNNVPPIGRTDKLVTVTYPGLKSRIGEDAFLIGAVSIPEKKEVTITIQPLNNGDYTYITADNGESTDDRTYTFIMEKDRVFYINISDTMIEKVDFLFGIDGKGFIEAFVVNLEDNSVMKKYEIRTNSKVAFAKNVFEKSEVSLQAIASNNYIFERWSDGHQSPNHQITGTMDDRLVAFFREGSSIAFKFLSKGSGYIDIAIIKDSDKTTNSRYRINAGEDKIIPINETLFIEHSVMATATAGKWNIFEQWDDGSKSETIEITKNSAKTITANFVPEDTIDFNFEKEGNGYLHFSITNASGVIITNADILLNSKINEKVYIPKTMLTNTMVIKANADVNYDFYGFSGGIVSDKEEIVITKDNATKPIVSTFKTRDIEFSFTRTGSGFINVRITNSAGTVITNLNTVSNATISATVGIPRTMLTGNTMRVKAMGENWNYFDKWASGLSGTEMEQVVTENNASTTMTAVFTANYVNFNFIKTGNGFINIIITNPSGETITNLNALIGLASTVEIPKAMLSTNTMRAVAYPDVNDIFYKYSGSIISREPSSVLVESNSQSTIKVEFLAVEQPTESAGISGWVYISKPEHLLWLASEVNKTNYVVSIGKYKFKNEINFANKPHISIGGYGSPFKGIIDGNNQTLKGAVYTAYDSYVYASGLIGVADGSTISNIIIDSSVVITNTANSSGGVVGSAKNTIISNCVNNANLTADPGRFCDSGGIVGNASSGTYIYNSYNTGNINGFSAGGIVGNIYDSTTRIINVYNTGNINGSRAGGIVGYASGPNFVNAYSIAPSIVGGTYLGGLIGQYTPSSISLANSYHVHVAGNNSGFANMQGDSINRTITTANLSTLTSTFNTATPGVWKNITVNSVTRPVLIGVGEGK